jgi:hypothetical protein
LICAQPSGQFGIEAKVKLDFGVAEDAPSSRTGAELNATFIHPVIVSSAFTEKQSKAAEVWHRVPLLCG